MQLIHSEYCAEEYLSALKERTDSPFHFFFERLTGCFLGKFFYVTHHSEYQWDRKFGNPKNAALGFVENSENGCQVRFFTFKGLLCPSQFLLLLTSCLLMGLLLIWYTETYHLISIPWLFFFIFLFVAIAAPVSALFESFTDRSTEGENALLSILYDPVNF